MAVARSKGQRERNRSDMKPVSPNSAKASSTPNRPSPPQATSSGSTFSEVFRKTQRSLGSRTDVLSLLRQSKT